MTWRVLLVEDSSVDAKLVVSELKRAGRPIEHECVQTADAMGDALARSRWDLVLSDWSMPKFNAREALRILKESKLDLPFIIVSGSIGEEAAVEAMRAGAHDYVFKDRLGRLVPAIERELREVEGRAARRKAEAALSQTEARFRRLYDSGIIGITISDLEGGILEANDAYLKMLGYTREEMLSGAVRWADLTPPELAHFDERALRQLAESGVAQPWETESFRKDGSRVPILVGVAMLEASKGIAFIIDLTEKKHAEEARAVAEDALRRTEEQLRHAQKMEAVGRLAGGVAHDFNNVLSVIMSYAELAIEALAPEDPLRADIEEMRKAAERAAGLTRQLLLFSRHQISEPKVVDLHELLVGMRSMVARLVGEDVELRLVPPASSGLVKVDPGRFEQVILNLVVNARDAMPVGGRLTMETSNVVWTDAHIKSVLPPKPGSYVRLVVADTGSGMNAETQARIFEPFFTTKEKGKGTGLGLSTLFGIVSQSGGNICVESEPGKGTTFEIYLPRVDGQADPLRPDVPAATLRGRETVLLVEDEEQVRTVAANILERYGYSVVSAAHPQEALALCDAHPGAIDVVVTDVVMPIMSGPELVKLLLAKRPTLKALYMSGYTDDSISHHGALGSEIALLEKPITPLSLGTRLRQVLDGGAKMRGDDEVT